MPVFMKMDGIDGESMVQGHERWIEIDSFQFGVERATSGPGGGGGGGRPNLSDVSLTKNLDKSTPKLFLHCCKGQHIPNAVIEFTRSVGSGQQETYLKYELKNVLVSSYNVGGSGGEDRPTESLSLNYTEIKFEYKPQGSPPTGAFWNVQTNTGGLTGGGT